MAYQLAKAMIQIQAAMKRCQQLAGEIKNRPDADLISVIDLLARRFGWTPDQIGNLTADQVEALLQECLKDVGLDPKDKRWTLPEAIEEIRPLYRKGVFGRNELVRRTGIPAGTVSNALEQLRETEPAKPLKNDIPARSYSNLENVELSRLVQEQAEDKEPSPLDETGNNPRVNRYQG